MTFSWCVPCRGREADLLVSWPALARAWEPGVELVLVDYGCTPPLAETVTPAEDRYCLLTRMVRVEAPWYRMAHARNVAIRAAVGDVIVISSTDITPQVGYFSMLRARFEETGAYWLEPTPRYLGVIAVQRQALLDAGGFDERFDYYGPEDRELAERLHRRGLAHATYPSSWLSVRPTPQAEKRRHYAPMPEDEMYRRGRTVWADCQARAQLVANDGLEWGQA